MPHAFADDAPELANGYVTVDINGISYSYQIYTVRRGQLAGQRVIKRGVSGIFRAFAFIEDDGSLALWRRFAGDVHTDYVSVAVRLVGLLRERSGTVGNFSENLGGQLWRIQFVPCCRRCNAHMSMSALARGHGFLCSDCFVPDDRPAVDLGDGFEAERRRPRRVGSVMLSELGTGEEL